MQVGERFERRFRWTTEEIVAFARAVEDRNPMHHDAAFAGGTRFGGLIASGAHPIAFLLGILGSTATPENPGVGLEFAFRLAGPLRPDETYVFAWEVVEVAASERPRGTLVKLAGTVAGEDGRAVVTADATTLMVVRL